MVSRAASANIISLSRMNSMPVASRMPSCNLKRTLVACTLVSTALLESVPGSVLTRDYQPAFQWAKTVRSDSDVFFMLAWWLELMDLGLRRTVGSGSRLSSWAL